MSPERKARNSQNLTQGSIKQALISMTIPMIVGMIMLFTFSLVDTFFVSLLGNEALAAISFTFPVTFSVMSMAIGLGIGASAVVGKNLGSDDTETSSNNDQLCFLPSSNYFSAHNSLDSGFLVQANGSAGHTPSFDSELHECMASGQRIDCLSHDGK